MIIPTKKSDLSSFAEAGIDIHSFDFKLAMFSFWNPRMNFVASDESISGNAWYAYAAMPDWVRIDSMRCEWLSQPSSARVVNLAALDLGVCDHPEDSLVDLCHNYRLDDTMLLSMIESDDLSLLTQRVRRNNLWRKQLILAEVIHGGAFELKLALLREWNPDVLFVMSKSDRFPAWWGLRAENVICASAVNVSRNTLDLELFNFQVF